MTRRIDLILIKGVVEVVVVVVVNNSSEFIFQYCSNRNSTRTRRDIVELELFRFGRNVLSWVSLPFLQASSASAAASLVASEQYSSFTLFTLDCTCLPTEEQFSSRVHAIKTENETMRRAS